MSKRACYLTPDIGLIDVAPPGMSLEIGVYVLKGKKIALIDTGPTSGLENLLAGLAELKVNPEDVNYILASHVHLDHTGGMGGALKSLPGAMVVVHEKGSPHLEDPTRLWQSSLEASGELARQYGAPEPVSRDRLIVAQEGMTIDLGDMKIEVIFTPGHAPHNLSFLERRRKEVFVGEAAGAYNTDIDLLVPAAPPPFNLEQAVFSVDKLISLAPETLYYSHFGKAENALEKLHRQRKQLFLWGRTIAENPGLDPLAIFERIKQQDKTLERLRQLPSERQQQEWALLNLSIRGFAEYFRRYGTAYLNKG